jgi:radical SAM-linked protein
MARAATAESRAQSTAATARPSAAVFFSLGGDLRYLAHLDEVRMLARALHRADWPVAYSQGFNPLPRVKLPLPRRVAVASACELALVELSAARGARELYESLAATLPAGCGLERVILLARPVRPQPLRVRYEVDLTREHACQTASHIDALLAATAVTVEREYGPARPARAIDVRPWIETIALDDCTLSMLLAYVDQRSARPTEVLKALHLPAGAYNHCVRRAAVAWNIDFAGLEQWPAQPERNTVGQEESDDTQTQEHVA